jgi:glycosyltransferase involved in cell wall biosynthesis
VVTDVGDAAKIVGDTGVVVAPGDSAALADGLQQLAALGTSERRLLGERARARNVRDYGIDRMIERYDSLYRELYDVRHHRIRSARPAP